MSIIDTFVADAEALWSAVEPQVLSDLLEIAEYVLAGFLTGGVSIVTTGHVGDIMTEILGHAENQLKLDVVNLEPVVLNAVVSTFVAGKVRRS